MNGENPAGTLRPAELPHFLPREPSHSHPAQARNPRRRREVRRVVRLERHGEAQFADGKGIGSTEGMGICHSYTPDGRCVSLLKILLTNYCIYDCLYCVNRASSNAPRARFSVAEVVQLTLEFYRRNYIEGLFLSSGIIRTPDYTMEQVDRRRAHAARRARLPRLHPPEDDSRCERRADRARPAATPTGSASTSSCRRVRASTRSRPRKTRAAIRKSMARLRMQHRRRRGRSARAAKRAPRFAPAGQSTQMIVGADESSDRSIIDTSASLYGSYRLRRVYYSAFSPIPDAAASLPLSRPPLVREHRLYQADWLMRFYGFAPE